MPTYDFKCQTCGKRLDNQFQPMSADNPECCGEKMETVPGLCNGYVFPAEGITLEHVASTPQTFYSKKEMVNYANKHNLELGALL